VILFAFLTGFNSVYADQVFEVSSKVVDLGVVTETYGKSVKRVLLKISPESPKEFKVKFNYKYRFTSKELDSVIVTPGGFGGFSTRTVSESFEANEILRFDASESSAQMGDDLAVIIEISKPNQNIHGIKVAVKLVEEKGNTIDGGRRLLGLLGRSYKIKANCELPF
jgi:hypothetical protein